MRMTTKAVWNNLEDFCAGLPPDQWEGYEYHGEVAQCGQLFANLTKQAIQTPGANGQPGPTTYYNPALAGQAFGAASAAAAPQPQASEILNPTIGPDGSEGGQVVTHEAYTPPQPVLSHPAFDPLLHPEQLSRKGQILDLILNGAQGAASGWSAGQVTNPKIQPSLGPSFAAGLATPGMLRQQAVERQAQETQLGQDAQLRQAQVDNLPQQRAMGVAQLADTLSQTNERNAKAAMYANGKPDADQAASLQLQLSHATAAAIAARRDPATDPLVQQIQSVIDGGKADKAPTGVDNDNRFLDITTRQGQGQPVSAVDAAFAKSYLKMKTAGPTAGAIIRNEGMAQNREYPVLDTQNGNSPMFLNAGDINTANRQQPGRYMPAGTAAPALTKTALIEDIRGNVQAVRGSLQNMPEFTPTMRTQVAVALKSRDPKSAVSSLMGSEAAKTMSPEQQDYLINTSLLIENAMAMRSVLGAGQGSEDLRSAITATIPGPTTPTKGYAGKQLDAFEQVLNRLEKGIPTVPLRNQGGKSGNTTPNQAGTGATSGTAVSLTAARQLPAMKGKSDAEITQAIQAAGHQVVQ